MTETKQHFDARQTSSRDVLDQLASSSGQELDALMRSVNSELTSPLRLISNNNLVVSIGADYLSAPLHSRNRAIAPIANKIPNLTGGSVTVPPSSGGNITSVTTGPDGQAGAYVSLTIFNGYYVKVGISITALGTPVITLGAQATTVDLASVPAVPQNTHGIGYFVVKRDDSILPNNIQPILDSAIYQYPGGARNPAGGDANSVTETIKNHMMNSQYNLMTSNIAYLNQLNLIGASLNVVYDPVENSFVFSAPSAYIDTINMLDSTEFNADPANLKDIWDLRLLSVWDLNYIDTSAQYQVTRDSGLHWHTLVTSRLGNATDTYFGDYVWSREDEDSYAIGSGSTAADLELNAIAAKDYAGAFSLFASSSLLGVTRSARIVSFSGQLKKYGTPDGYYRLSVYSSTTPNVAGGSPSTLLAASDWILANSLSTNYAAVNITISTSSLIEGYYFFVFETDAAYKATFSSLSKSICVAKSGSGTNLVYSYNGIVWAAVTNSTMYISAGAMTESFNTGNLLVNDSLYSISTNALNATTQVAAFQPFTVSTAGILKRINLKIKATGSPVGGFWVGIVSGLQNFTYLARSRYISASEVTTSVPGVDFYVDIPTLPLAASAQYSLVIETDATYKTNTFGVNSLVIDQDAGNPAGSFYTSSTTWTATNGFYMVAYGRPLDVQVKVVSSAGGKKLKGYALFYDMEVQGVSNGIKLLDQRVFSDNQNSFTLSWTPDPDLLVVYYIEANKVYRFPYFQISGYTVVFPVNTFNAGATTLVFDQTRGTSFDNSDQNSALLTENHLGSLTANLDRSVSGRGIYIRNAAGVLRELVLDASDNLQVYSV